MAVRFPSYLHRNLCGIYGFRFVVTRDLRGTFAYSERRVSLQTPILRVAKTVAYSLAHYAGHRLVLIRAMREDEAKASAEQFLSDLVAERDRIGVRFGEVTLSKATSAERMNDAGQRFRQLLAFIGHPIGGPAPQVNFPTEMLRLMGRTAADDVPTHFELALDAVSAES